MALEDGAKDIALGLAAIVGWTWAVISWFGKREVKRVEDALKELADLKMAAVTKAELASAISEFRSERREMHRENQELLTDIRETIDENEKRDSNTRHDIRDEVHSLVTKHAVLDKRMETIEQHIKRTPPRRS